MAAASPADGDPAAPFFGASRSPVLARHAVVACSQPLAAEVGLRVLRAGGNCVDASVAVAAALNVTEPCQTGVGGDAFALFYDAETRKVSGLNGSGRCPRALTLAAALRLDMSARSVHNVTVPGTAAAWCDALERWGTLPLRDVLAPAIELARDGFAVGPVTAALWQQSEALLRERGAACFLTAEGRAPRVGDVMRNPDLARTFEALAAGGRDGFYKGRVAEALVAACAAHDGLLDLADLDAHASEFVEPISTTYHGVTVHECPPNGQGLTALLALNMLSELEEKEGEKQEGDHAGDEDEAERLHRLIEALRLAFADARQFVADSADARATVPALLSRRYAAERAALVDPARATADVRHGRPLASSDTVSFVVVDAAGNACSFIQSNYMGFGTAIVPEGCGFSLQNRGANFSLEEGHANCLAPGKRPYHTIIPGMATYADDGTLFGPFTVMGGFMQPQGHVQVLVNMLARGMDPQRALDAPRVCIPGGGGDDDADAPVCVEEGTPPAVVARLRAKGHRVRVCAGVARAVFGRGQIVRRDRRTGVLWAGSDTRADGLAVGW